ncbi:MULTISPECIES: heptaprenyl diphosphate synthase component 1 [Bacillus]|uniref:Heptaprenyl diphosphate synthase n=2 Tax=Bacillus TaxID=1386 RepID=A0A0M3R9H0_9BACI|nr:MULTISPECIES: heptaprenyl diphosphate synthase component 1 [Bacillus]ALC81422.1 heptaprenyl diphosphate synthase [Bacillus gobiensis]MBP1080454.1 heptaprenyl diphosphate synthase [Bacillus capparidis]MED1094311.1 heptaprenyl diphosphate synthase component 1 [Bacillus capparidis]
MHDIDKNIFELEKKLNKKLSHPYLAKNLPAPKVDRDKLFLFHALFEESVLAEADKENYIITAMLVQIALDTHEDVNTETALALDDQKNRQLTVLAGDYFSGLYYSLLSDMKDIFMIRTLATAIKEINEHKVRLYDRSINDLNAFFSSLGNIESALFKYIAEHLKIPSWNVIANDFLVYKRIMSDPKLFKPLGGESPNSSYFSDHENQHEIKDSRYNIAVASIKELLSNKPLIQTSLIDRLNAIKQELWTYHQKVEEG